MTDRSRRLDEVVEFLDGDASTHRYDLVVAERTDGGWSAGQLPIDTDATDRLGAFVVEAARPLLADAREVGQRRDVEGGDESVTFLDRDDLDVPSPLEPVVTGDRVGTYRPPDDLPDAGFLAARLHDTDHSVVGVQVIDGTPWQAGTPFTVLRTAEGYETRSDPFLAIPDDLDAVFVDGSAFVFDERVFGSVLDTGNTAPTDGPADDPEDDRPVVLVVDDEPDMAEMFELWLDGPYNVRTAVGGTAALEAFDDRVDAVLLDRRMPDMTGDEVLERLRAQGAHCGIAMVTAAEADGDIVDMSFDDYVTKPASREEILETVEGLLAVEDYGEIRRELSSMRVQRNVLRIEGNNRGKAFERLETSIEMLQSRLAAAGEGEREGPPDERSE